jgi:hypothetical protein
VRVSSGGGGYEEYVAVRPRKDTRVKGIPVSAATSGDPADNCRAERLVDHSEVCHFPKFFVLSKGR